MYVDLHAGTVYTSVCTRVPSCTRTQARIYRHATTTRMCTRAGGSSRPARPLLSPCASVVCLGPATLPSFGSLVMPWHPCPPPHRVPLPPPLLSDFQPDPTALWWGILGVGTWGLVNSYWPGNDVVVLPLVLCLWADWGRPQGSRKAQSDSKRSKWRSLRGGGAVPRSPCSQTSLPVSAQSPRLHHPIGGSWLPNLARHAQLPPATIPIYSSVALWLHWSRTTWPAPLFSWVC